MFIMLSGRFNDNILLHNNCLEFLATRVITIELCYSSYVSVVSINLKSSNNRNDLQRGIYRKGEEQ